jgi:transcriptional regulator with XRE-family HTH domain
MIVNRGRFCFAQPGPPNHLRAYRAFSGKTQADLAATLGCSIALISKIERSLLRPRRETAEQLAISLGFDAVVVFPELGLDSRHHLIGQQTETRTTQ